MADKVIEPLSAWPETEAFKTPDGLPAFKVTPCVLTPFRARVADGCVDLTKVVLGLGCAVGFFLTYDEQQWLMQAAIWLAILVAGNAAAFRLLPRLFRKRFEIVMTTTRVGVKLWGRWRWIDRETEHRYVLHLHDRTLYEQRQLDVARQVASLDRKVHAPRVYFGDSRHLVMEVAGHRIDLLTVFGPVDAAAILARLLYLDRELDAAISRGKGVRQRAEDDWDEAPGDVA
jgi:hypothetical protein